MCLALIGTGCGKAPEVTYERMSVALGAGDIAAMERMLGTGFDPDLVPKGKLSLLSSAIYAKNPTAVRLLLKHGADVDRQEGTYQGTAIMFAADSNDIDMVDLLLAHGARVDSRDGSHGDSAINWAAYAGHYAMVEHLLAKGADPGIFGHGNALDIAMRRGHQSLVELLANHMQATRTPSANEALLLAAIESGDEEQVREALDAGASANSLDRFNRPVIGAAARRKGSRMLEILIDAGADVDATDPIGYTALMEASRDKRPGNVRLLLEHGADVNHVSRDNGLALTPLHLAGIGGSAEIVEALVKHGAKMDVKGTIGTTPLLWALFEGQTEAGIRLLELGAAPTIATTEGYDASDFASDNKDERLAIAIAAWHARHQDGK